MNAPNNVSVEQPSANSAKKQRKEKPLPAGIQCLTAEQISAALTLAEELDANDKSGEPVNVLVATHIHYVETGQDGIIREFNVELDTLTVDQLRKLALLADIRGCASANKFKCRLALAINKTQNEKHDKKAKEDQENETVKVVNTQLRLINAVFHPEMLPKVLSVTDSKSRSDHELGQSEREIWISVADLINHVTVPDDAMNHVHPCSRGDRFEYLVDGETYHAFDLTKTNIVDSKIIKTFLRRLTQGRQNMVDAMEQSGTHDSDPMNFVRHAALDDERIPKQIHLKTLYYFYCRCEDNPEFVMRFQTIMSDKLKGSSSDDASKWSINKRSSSNAKNKKKVLEQVTNNMNAFAGLADVVAKAFGVKEEQRAMEMKEREAIRAKEQAEKEEEKNERKKERHQEMLLSALKSGVLTPQTHKSVYKSYVGSLMAYDMIPRDADFTHPELARPPRAIFVDELLATRLTNFQEVSSVGEPDGPSPSSPLQH